MNGESVKNGYEKKELPKRPDEVDGEKFVEDPYEDVANQKRAEENFQDDGFATDEFDSASSDGGDVSTIPQTHQFRKLKRQNSSLNGSRRRQRKASSSVVLRMGLPWQVMHSSQMTAPSAGS